MHSHPAFSNATARKPISLNPCFNGRCTRTAGDNATHDLKNRVLILVLMEDALALFCFKSTNRNKRRVLILVLMEDALAQLLNAIENLYKYVLILVLMEDALAQQVAKLYSVFNSVLILVLMEDALALVDCDIEEVHKVCVFTSVH